MIKHETAAVAEKVRHTPYYLENKNPQKSCYCHFTNVHIVHRGT